MRKVFFLAVLLAILQMSAVSVTVEEATEVADFFLEVNCDTLEIIDIVKFKKEGNDIVAFIANLDPTGFIAVSTNTDIKPVVAFSLKHDFIYDDNQNNALYHLLMTDMENRKSALSVGQLPNTAENNALWSNYLNNNWNYFNQRDPEFWPPEGSTSTGGWVETTWTQSYPYNSFCPIDPESDPPERCVVGCPGTAISQVLNYNRFIGEHEWNWTDDHYTSTYTYPNIEFDDDHETYDFPSFDELNDYLDVLRLHYLQGDPLTEDDISAICFAAGIACKTSYSESSSGASSLNIASVFVDKFEYDYIEIISFALSDIYCLNLEIDMKNAQPAIILIMSSVGGHVIVCDGYMINDEDEDLFHLNFGWGDGSPANITEAWYDLPELYGDWNLYGPTIGHICKPGYNGYVSGNIQLNGEIEDVTDVTVTVGYKTTHPDVNGDYEIEIYNGNYDVSVYLWGYETVEYENIPVFANITSELDFNLQSRTPTYIYIPTDYSTIQAGIDAAEDGDLVIVLPGEYFENINFNGKMIKVVSWYYFGNDKSFIDNTIINGSSGGRVVEFNSGEDFNSSLIGFTITGGQASSSAGIYCYASSPTLEGLKITGNQAGFCAGIGLYDLYDSNSIFKDIEVYDNTNTHQQGSGAIKCQFSNVTFEDVSIFDNNQAGISITGSVINIVNSTICDNGYSDDGYVGVNMVSGDLIMNNCLVWDNNNGSEQILLGPSPTLEITYSDIQGINVYPGIGNLNVEPLLVDDGSYQPQWDETVFSPLIDAGDPNLFDPDGTRSDIGAIRAIEHKVDSIELIDETEGVNWKCFPVLDDVTTDGDIAENVLYDIMQPPYPTALHMVETQGGLHDIIFDYNEWINADQQFTSYKGYKIHMNDEYTLEITGFPEDRYHTLDLESGIYNWLGYFVEYSMKPLDAFEAVLDNIDKIKTRDFSLVKIQGEWFGTCEWTINYGDLVIVHCTGDDSFYWGEDGGGGVDKYTRPSSQDFSYTEEADYIPVMVELDTEALGNPSEIGIYVEDECKGAEVITDSLVQIRAYVFGDSTAFDPGEVSFQLSYGTRAANRELKSYRNKLGIDEKGETQTLDFSQRRESYYLISIKDTDGEDPQIISTSLGANYPNPFNPVTTINYSLAEKVQVELAIYNIKGQSVRTLVNDVQESGQYKVIWDGTNDNFTAVASGIYFYRMSAGDQILHKKMLLMK